MPGFLGKGIIILGVVLILIGLAILYGPKIPYIGRLPGDIYIQRDNVSCAFPIVTSIVLSIILTIILNVVVRLINK